MIGSSSVNFPENWGILTVTASRSDTILQEYEANTHYFYREYRSGAGWSEWHRIALKSEINSELFATGSIPLTITSGGSSVDTDGNLRWYRCGSIVIISCAFWRFNIVSPTESVAQFKLTFKNIGVRIIGAFGYNNSGKNYVPVLANTSGNSFGLCIKNNTNGSTSDVKGTDLTTFIGQFSVVYPTDGTVIS